MHRVLQPVPKHFVGLRSSLGGGATRGVRNAPPPPVEGLSPVGTIPAIRPAPWLVMDMDGTIVQAPAKAGGHYPSLAWSPCCTPLETWIEHGGNLCVISTAGRRMYRQVYDVLKHFLIRREHQLPSAVHPGRLVLCGYSGAGLYVSEPECGGLIEDLEYRTTAVEGGTCISPDAVPEIEALLVDRFDRLFALATEDPDFVARLSNKYQAPYKDLVEQRRRLGGSEFRKRFLTPAILKTPGAVLKETNNSMLSIQVLPESDAVAQVSILGVPMTRFNDIFEASDFDTMAKHGLDLRRQPNSALIARHAVSKATCIRWMVDHAERYGFSLNNAIAVGDAPLTIDRSLTLFPEMPFISVSPSAKDDPSDCMHLLRVGGEELGCSRFLSALNRCMEERANWGSMPNRDELNQVCADARMAYGGF